MATYKVIQDIEAEDKLVGPLTLRQFVYGAIAALCAYMSFFAVTKGFGLALVILIPPMLFTGFFAFPFGRDQPTEVWALAKIRYYLKSRRRIWNQSGVKELVQITAPKKVERNYTNGLSQHEVQSRLTALATTLDTRGWAVKNMNTNLFTPAMAGASSSDRLVDLTDMPQAVSSIDITAADDILDEQNNPRAHQLQELVAQSSMSHRQQLVDQLNKIRQVVNKPAQPAVETPQSAPADYWFLNKPVDLPQPTGGNVIFSDAPVITAGEDAATVDRTQGVVTVTNEAELSEVLHEKREKSQSAIANQHLKTIQPLNVEHPIAPTPPPSAAPEPVVTPPPKPATIGLANRNDLNIATIARIAKQNDDADEVVISLHGRNS